MHPSELRERSIVLDDEDDDDDDDDADDEEIDVLKLEEDDDEEDDEESVRLVLCVCRAGVSSCSSLSLTSITTTGDGVY